MVPLLAAAVTVGTVEGLYGLVLGAVSVPVVAYIAITSVRRGTTWYLPFVVVAIAPAITVPAQEIMLGVLTDNFAHNASLYNAFGIDTAAGTCVAVYNSGHDKEWACPRAESTLSLVPGVLNLVAFGWLWSGSRRTRFCSVIAGGLGALRLLIPAAIYLSSPQVHFIGSYQFYSGATVNNISPFLSVFLWMLSLLAFVLVGMATQRYDTPQPPKHARPEPVAD